MQLACQVIIEKELMKNAKAYVIKKVSEAHINYFMHDLNLSFFLCFIKPSLDIKNNTNYS